MKYKVSVIIPVYNCERFLERAVRSVICQPDFDSIQLILVDDGSKDNSGKLCDDFSAKYDNIISLHQENAGVSAARNLGIDRAEGEWISFVDSDDYVLDGIYEKMDRDVDLICCSYTGNGISSDTLDEMLDDGIYERSEFEKTLYPVMACNYIFYQCWNKLYKKSIIEKYNIRFPVGVKLAEDMIFVYEYVRHIDSFCFVKEPLYYYYFSDNGASGIVKKGYETYRMIYTFLSDYFIDVGYSADGLTDDFVSRSLAAVYTAAVSLDFISSVKYIKNIFSDDLFFDNYIEKRTYKDSGGVNGLLDSFIVKKMPTAVVLLARLNELRSKRMSGQ